MFNIHSDGDVPPVINKNVLSFKKTSGIGQKELKNTSETLALYLH